MPNAKCNPPGWPTHKDWRGYHPPPNFSGIQWLNSLTRRQLEAHVARPIRNHPVAFTNEQIWYYATHSIYSTVTIQDFRVYEVLICEPLKFNRDLVVMSHYHKGGALVVGEARTPLSRYAHYNTKEHQWLLGNMLRQIIVASIGKTVLRSVKSERVKIRKSLPKWLQSYSEPESSEERREWHDRLVKLTSGYHFSY